MAVTLTVAELKQPGGELSNNYFPAGDLDTQLIGWLSTAATKVEADATIATANQNDAAAAWIYYRAYDYIATQLAALPSSASEGNGAIAVSISDGRIKFYQDKAAAKLAKFASLQLVVPASVIGFHFGLAPGRRGR